VALLAAEFAPPARATPPAEDQPIRAVPPAMDKSARVGAGASWRAPARAREGSRPVAGSSSTKPMTPGGTVATSPPGAGASAAKRWEALR
ncbi:serine/threonine-protein phosphatase, partial [Frankia sp. AiPs1]|nr:serine/threonine-protein phosphatase [Frankia sp. AiPs1]